MGGGGSVELFGEGVVGLCGVEEVCVYLSVCVCIKGC